MIAKQFVLAVLLVPCKGSIARYEDVRELENRRQHLQKLQKPQPMMLRE